MKTKLYDNIRKRRLELEMSQDELAQKTGYSDKSMISKIEGGKVDLTQSKIYIFAKALKTNPGDLMGDVEESEYFDNIFQIDLHRYPLAGEIACGKPIYADEDRESYVMAGTAIRADFCLRAKGDSMINARIYDGDIVFIRKDEELINGEIYAVAIGDEATLKRVYLDKEKNTVQLVAENPKYQPLVYIGDELNTIHILGKAIAFQSDIR